MRASSRTDAWSFIGNGGRQQRSVSRCQKLLALRSRKSAESQLETIGLADFVLPEAVVH